MGDGRGVQQAQGQLLGEFGIDVARAAFAFLGDALSFDAQLSDGDALCPGTVIARVEGPAPLILSSERVALNFLGHMSGIATATSTMVDAVAGTGAKICCTRKTTPGLRAFEKYAVRAGGGANHRFGLYDAVLIKDNHIAIAGGIKPALEVVFSAGIHMAKVEIEVDTLDQLAEVLEYPVDVILLDNMDAATLKSAVKMNNGHALLEASGGITLETVRQVAETGVDLISVGWLTHSAPCLDVGLDFDNTG